MVKEIEIKRLEIGRHILSDLYDKGVIYSEGNVLKKLLVYTFKTNSMFNIFNLNN